MTPERAWAQNRTRDREHEELPQGGNGPTKELTESLDQSQTRREKKPWPEKKAGMGI